MTYERHEVGYEGELVAAGDYEQRGFDIVARNFTVHGLGEIDLIARKGGELVFVEVRSRMGSDPDVEGIHPLATITRAKLRRVERAAAAYLRLLSLREASPLEEIRIELVSVVFTAQGPVLQRCLPDELLLSAEPWS